MSILAVGTVAFDTIETPFGSVDKILGGSATYITLSARFFCDDVRLDAVVGDDFPDEYRNLLSKNEVDISGLQEVSGGKTFAWEGRYHYDLNDRDTLATHLNVLMDFEPRVPEAFKDSKILCLGNLDPTIQLKVLDQVTKPDLVICDTMNFWIENTPDKLRSLLKKVDCLVINDAEARQLSGEPNLVRAARIIQEMGPEILVIKKGEHGAMLFAEGAIFSAPAYPLEDIQDPTGAGDTFMGGFAGYLSSDGLFSLDSFKRAMIYGSAIASYSVECFGTDRLLDLKKEEIEKRVEEFRALSAIPVLVAG